MAQSIILACGNPLRGDDGVALRVICGLQEGYTDPETEICCAQQWTPDLAESVSKSQLAIFVDASAAIPPGEIRVVPVSGRHEPPGLTTHSLSPQRLLELSLELFQRVPERAFLLTIGGASFEHGDQLSASVQRAVPVACNQLKALLSGVTLPDSPQF
jgi:hydrogenase maturation protease